MVVRGEGSSVTFENVKFHESCLIVVEGARVVIQDCAFTIADETGTGIHLFAHGAGTYVCIAESIIDGGVQACASTLRAHACCSARALRMHCRGSHRRHAWCSSHLPCTLRAGAACVVHMQLLGGPRRAAQCMG